LKSFLGMRLRGKKVKQKKERKMIKMLRKANALVTCAALTYATLPADVLAKDFDKRVQTSSDITSAALGVMGNIQNIAQQYQTPQMSQGQIQAMQTFQQFQNDAQSKLGADQMGASRHYIFNNCMVPPDKALRPIGLCQSSAIPPEMMAASMKVAQDYINMYDKHLRPQNTAGSTGKQCIENSLKSLADQANTMLADFDKMMKGFEAQRKETENQLQMQRKKIADEYALLNGTKNGRASIDSKNVDYRKMFPKECTDIMGTGQLSGQGKSQGLRGIRDTFANTDETAANYRGPSLNNVKKQIDRDKKILQDKIKKSGMSGLSSKTLLTGVQFKGVFTKALQDQFTPMNEDIQRANAVLSELGVADKVPSLTDPSFEIKMNQVLNKAQASYQDEFILDCMRGQNAAAHSTPLSSIIGSFEHRVAENKGTTIDNFKNDASGAIGSATTIAGLESQINQLNNNKITVAVRNENNKKVSKTLDQYFNDIKSECTQIYNGDIKPAGDIAKLENYKKQSDQAKEQLTSIKESMDKMVVSKNGSGQQGSIEAMVDDLINNCGGEVVEATQCSTKGVYEKGSPSFCLKRATKCSTLVNACNLQAEKYVTDKTNQLKAMSDQYNASVKQLEDTANAMTEAMNRRVEDMAKSLHGSLFPSSLPPEVKAMYGIPTYTGLQQDPNLKQINATATDQVFPGLFLKGGGKDITSLGKDLKGNTQKIKKMFSDHVNEQVNYAKSIIEGNLKQWEEEKQKWTEFRQECTSAIASMQENAIKQQQEAATQQQEADSKRLQFCQKYAAMAAAPGCDGDYSPESLYSEAIEISGHLGQDVFPALDEYRNVCLQSQNEGQDDDSTTKNHLAATCQQYGNSPSRVKERLLENLMDEIPSQFKDKKDEIKEFITLDNTERTLEEIHEDLENHPYANKISDLQSLYEFKGSNSFLASGEEQFPYPAGATQAQKDAIDKKRLNWTDFLNTEHASELPKTSDVGYAENDFCADFQNQANIKRVKSCGSSSSINTFEDCMTDKKDDTWGQEYTIKRGRYANANSALQKLTTSGKQNAWAEIGEKTGGTSCAHIAGGRNFNTGSIFEQLGQMDSIGAGQNPFGSFR